MTELFCFYLASHGIYNHFVISIGQTISAPFLFGFFFINTRSSRKRYAIIILYMIIIGYLTIGGYYHPKAILPNTASVFFDSISFLATLLHLTDLLENPQSEHFRFQLKMNLSILIFFILSAFLTSVYWIDNHPGSRMITALCFANQIFIQLAFICIFITEMLKLRRAWFTLLSIPSRKIAISFIHKHDHSSNSISFHAGNRERFFSHPLFHAAKIKGKTSWYLEKIFAVQAFSDRCFVLNASFFSLINQWSYLKLYRISRNIQHLYYEYRLYAIHPIPVWFFIHLYTDCLEAL